MQNYDNSERFPFGQKSVWKLPQVFEGNSNLKKFQVKAGFADYKSLFKKSIEDIEWFWDFYLKHLDIKFETQYQSILDVSRGPEFPKWCVGGKLNIIDSCVSKWRSKKPKAEAIVYENENGEKASISYEELDNHVVRLACELKKLGIKKGQSVALCMPMNPTMVYSFLAIIKLGAVVVPLFTGFGGTALSSRIRSSGATFVLCAESMSRRGKLVPLLESIVNACESILEVQKILVPNLSLVPLAENANSRVHYLNIGGNNKVESLKSEIMDSEDPLMIIYTSGTTGQPKGAVHSHCGFPIKAACDIQLYMDLKESDRFCWLTDIGWMMGPWLIFGTLLCGATMYLYDGAPDYPDAARLLTSVQDNNITHLGFSPSYVRGLMHNADVKFGSFDFHSLKMICSTGSPWDNQSWNFVFEKLLGKAKPIINYSGGTEIGGGILCGNMLSSLKPCSFSGPVLGMDAEVWDADGQSVKNQVGELIIKKPWIGMTRSFWQDDERYLNAYWKQNPGVWTHGDFAAIDEDELWYILGRSDDTLKISGKRIGPAEVECILNSHPSVIESAVIGVPHPLKDTEIVGFCVISQIPDAVDERFSLKNELSEMISRELGKPLKPKEICLVNALPKTRNAKIMHRVVRSVYLNTPLGDLSGCESLEVVENLKLYV